MALTTVDQGLLNQYAQYTGFKNRIINGAMVINQRGFNGNAVEFTYTLDRWITFTSGSNLWSVSQNAGSVTPPAGFTNYLGVTSLAATTPGAAERNLLCQMVEGYNISDFGWGYSYAQPITISFWVRSSLTGTFGASINSTTQAVAATFSYTINVANTWEYKTITVQGPTSSPSNWDTTNGRGLWLFFDLGSGSNFAADTTWTAATKYTISSASRKNVVGTNGATFYITGVQLEKGSTATSFDYRPYGTELALCQRYYEVKSCYGCTTNTMYAGYRYYNGWHWFVPKRVSPTVSVNVIGVYPGGSSTNVGISRSDVHIVAVQDNAAQATLLDVIVYGNAEL